MLVESMGQEFGQGEGLSLLQNVQGLSREDIMAGGDLTAGVGITGGITHVTRG